MNSNSADAKALARIRGRLENKLVDELDRTIQRLTPAYHPASAERRKAIRDYIGHAMEKAVEQDRRFRARRGVR